jgi:hypothetical protein
MNALLEAAKNIQTLIPEFKAASNELVKATNEGAFSLRARAGKKDLQ